jgi:hypothetical protein
LSEPKVFEFKNADVRIEVFRYDTKITITKGLGEDPITILVSQNLCSDPNRLANELIVDAFEEVG